jgi:phenylalanyl-tRNA synthetase beta chain
LSWLNEWIDLPSSIREVSDLLLKVGVEVESAEKAGPDLPNVVVARILERAPHPQADRLSLCKVTDGTRDYAIVCGAPNCDAGNLVPLAREGAVLPGDFKIKRSKIRGVESEGMLCSVRELGLGTEGEGLMVLQPDLPLGKPLAEALGLGDTLLGIQTTANRLDQNSILGLARELSALTGRLLRWPASPLPPEPQGQDADFQVGVVRSEACPLYLGRILKGVKVEASPAWLAKRLEQGGFRPINVLVDVTHFILLELGQPLHAFDLAKLGGRQISVRPAARGEKLRTLDQRDFSLDDTDLVIAGADRPLALAGIMGGLDSGVSISTRDVFLEAAVFDPLWVRRSSRRLALSSDASYYFERGVDPAMTHRALDRAASLILELAGGSLGRSFQVGQAQTSLPPVPLRPGYLNALLGTALQPLEIQALLSRRGFEVREKDGQWQAVPPSHRREVSREADLAEEVAQLAGFESIPSTVPGGGTASPQTDDPAWDNAWMLREACLRQGLQEAATLTYCAPAEADAWGCGEISVPLENPLSEEQSLLRPSLLPNLAISIRHNRRHQMAGAALFEVGHVFRKSPAGQPPQEEERWAVLLAGRAKDKQWTGAEQAYDFFDLKGLLENLARSMKWRLRSQPLESRSPAAHGTEGLRMQPASAPPAWLHPGQGMQVNLGPLRGWAGALHPSLLKKLDLAGPVLAAELAGFSEKTFAKEPRWEPFSRLPAVARDLSCLVPRDLRASALLDFFSRETAQGRVTVRLVDLYEGGKLPADKRSLTFAFTYQSGEKSLTDQEVNALHEGLATRLEKAMPDVKVRRD